MSTADPARIPPDPSDPSDLSAPPGPPERPGRPTPPAAAAPPRRRVLAWDPGFDTLIAAVTLLGFWASYWAGTAVNPAFLYGGILIFGTVIPAWTILRYRREGWAGLGIRRRFLIISLLISAVLGAGSAFQVVALAAETGTSVLPHLLANLLVLWEPLFYPAASGIGTLQAGFAMGWPDVVSGSMLLVVQVLILLGLSWRTRPRAVTHPPAPPHP